MRPLLLPLAALLALASCAGDKRFDARGRVVGFGDDDHTVIVSHEAIKGYMPAMTMTMQARESVAGLAQGDPIGFTLVVTREASWIENIHPIADSLLTPATSGRSVFRPDDTLLDVGEALPQARLVDENGDSLALDSYRGRVLVIDFIYTRCPLPDYCPLLSGRFAELHDLFAGDEDVALLSVTLDPAYDTPAVLRDYRARYTRQPGGWHFATGTPAELQKVWGALGQFVLTDRQEIQHNLVAAIVGRDGRVQRYFRGKDWTVDEAAAAIREAL